MGRNYLLILFRSRHCIFLAPISFLILLHSQTRIALADELSFAVPITQQQIQLCEQEGPNVTDSCSEISSHLEKAKNSLSKIEEMANSIKQKSAQMLEKIRKDSEWKKKNECEKVEEIQGTVNEFIKGKTENGGDNFVERGRREISAAEKSAASARTDLTKCENAQRTCDDTCFSYKMKCPVKVDISVHRQNLTALNAELNTSKTKMNSATKELNTFESQMISYLNSSFPSRGKCSSTLDREADARVELARKLEAERGLTPEVADRIAREGIDKIAKDPEARNLSASEIAQRAARDAETIKKADEAVERAKIATAAADEERAKNLKAITERTDDCRGVSRAVGWCTPAPDPAATNDEMRKKAAAEKEKVEAEARAAASAAAIAAGIDSKAAESRKAAEDAAREAAARFDRGEVPSTCTTWSLFCESEE